MKLTIILSILLVFFNFGSERFSSASNDFSHPEQANIKSCENHDLCNNHYFNFIIENSGIYNYCKNKIIVEILIPTNNNVNYIFGYEGDVSASFNSGDDIYHYEILFEPINTFNYFSFYLSFEKATDILEKQYIYAFSGNQKIYLNKGSYETAYNMYLEDVYLNNYKNEYTYSEILLNKYKNSGNETSQIIKNINDPTRSQYTIEVSGLLRWKDDSQSIHPMQYVKVDIFSVDYGATPIASTNTSVDGTYSINFNDFYPNDIYVKVHAGNDNVIVKNSTNVEYIYESSIIYDVYPGDTAYINWTIDMSGLIGQAFQVGQATLVSSKYASAMNNGDLSSVNVIYPHNDPDESGCYYDFSAQAIYIVENTSNQLKSYASWDPIMHEYGHHVQREFSISNSPGGNHSITNLVDIHGKDRGIRLAWGEAYPTVFGTLAQQYYANSLQNINTVADLYYTSYNGLIFGIESNQYQSEGNEGAIIGLLWDIHDSDNSENFDSLSYSHTNFWNLITSSGSTTLSSFVNYINNNVLTLYQTLQLGKLLSHYGMAPSNISISFTNNVFTIYWDPQGTSASLPNNLFEIKIYSSSLTELISINNITNSYYTLTNNQLNFLITSGFTQFTLFINAKETNGTPITGQYNSYPKTFYL